MNGANEISGDGQISASSRPAAKKTPVRKKGLSEFSIKIQSAGGSAAGGEISCVWTDKTHKFNDINGMLKFIEEQCDAVWYPQPQRKLRGWDSQ